jgi:hypothetical protein
LARHPAVDPDGFRGMIWSPLRHGLSRLDHGVGENLELLAGHFCPCHRIAPIWRSSINSRSSQARQASPASGEIREKSARFPTRSLIKASYSASAGVKFGSEHFR